MTLARTFVLRGPEQAVALNAFLKGNAAAMAKAGTPLEVRVLVHKAHRSSQQNALHWVLLTTIEEQAWVGGRQFDVETWNEHMKRELLPEETARGVKKWRHLPDGSRTLSMSTSDLDVTEMTDYLDQLQAKAVTELGVMFEVSHA